MLFFPEEINSCLSSTPSFLFCLFSPQYSLSLVSFSLLLSFSPTCLFLVFRARPNSLKNRRICCHTFIFIASISHSLCKDSFKPSSCLCCHLLLTQFITRPRRETGPELRVESLGFRLRFQSGKAKCAACAFLCRCNNV